MTIPYIPQLSESERVHSIVWVVAIKLAYQRLQKSLDHRCAICPVDLRSTEVLLALPKPVQTRFNPRWSS